MALEVAVRGTKGADERSVPSFKGFTEAASPVSFSVGSGSQMIFSSLIDFLKCQEVIKLLLRLVLIRAVELPVHAKSS